MYTPEPAFVVKVCGITSQEDLSVAVEAGANAVGFNFYPKSPRYLDAEGRGNTGNSGELPARRVSL